LTYDCVNRTTYTHTNSTAVAWAHPPSACASLHSYILAQFARGNLPTNLFSQLSTVACIQAGLQNMLQKRAEARTQKMLWRGMAFRPCPVVLAMVFCGCTEAAGALGTMPDASHALALASPDRASQDNVPIMQGFRWLAARHAVKKPLPSCPLR
jgi:hypothetical protein